MKKILVLLLLFLIMTLNAQKTGICLSGGGALGYAHIGALQALEDNAIYPDEISGASMGAIIGALYANGYSPKDILEMIKIEQMHKVIKIFDYIPKPMTKKTGFSSSSRISNIIKIYIPHNSFENLKKKLFICVTNLSTGQYEIVESGNNLSQWVTASATIPDIFEMTVINGSYYCDGGVLNNFPVQPLTKDCKYIIGIDAVPYMPKKSFNSMLSSLILSVRVILKNNSLPGKKLCTYYIPSLAVEEFNESSFKKYKEIYQYGYNATANYIKEHPEMKKNLSRKQVIY